MPGLPRQRCQISSFLLLPVVNVNHVIAAWRQSGWNALPKMSTSLDTLSAAALVAKSPSNVESAANPLAAQHFGGTVGQSVLRPGEYEHH